MAAKVHSETSHSRRETLHLKQPELTDYNVGQSHRLGDFAISGTKNIFFI